MNISVCTTPAEITDDDIRNCIVVVIDVLRSSSTIIAALANGAREVIPVSTPAEAGELASRLDITGSLMGGEREGRQIEGFDLGNSPPQYAEDIVAGKTVFFSSSNGTPAILRVKNANRVIIGGFNNLSTVLEYLLQQRKEIIILCSGRSGRFSLEDFVCAGSMIAGLMGRLKGPDVSFNDAATAAAELYRRNMNLLVDVMRRSEHGKRLMEIGFGKDLSYCAQIDSHNVLPLYVEGKIRGLKQDAGALAETETATA
ncbi:2-phosphosulfolactate phosphatase [bacterium]|nr:2-phosphosulfolactate phosphatase [bacterium]